MICKLCDKEIIRTKRHIETVHKIPIKEYYDLWYIKRGGLWLPPSVLTYLTIKYIVISRERTLEISAKIWSISIHGIPPFNTFSLLNGRADRGIIPYDSYLVNQSSDCLCCSPRTKRYVWILLRKRTAIAAV